MAEPDKLPELIDSFPDDGTDGSDNFKRVGHEYPNSYAIHSDSDDMPELTRSSSDESDN